MRCARCQHCRLSRLAKRGKSHRQRLTVSGLLFHIQVIDAEFKRLTTALEYSKSYALGLPAGKERVKPLMQESGIYGKHKHKYKVTSNSKPHQPVASNFLNRQFKPEPPNQAWVSDITYPWTDKGWPYLAIVMDLLNRKIVGFSIRPRMTADLISDALRLGLEQGLGAEIIMHSDVAASIAMVAIKPSLRATALCAR